GIKAGLKEGGYTTTDNLKIDFINAEGDQSQVQTMSKKLVDNGNELLIGIATPAAQGLANATTELPIIMGAVTDPVGANLVTDLKNPGGNITGVSDQTPVADAVSLIKEITP
ncbi:ABC transporter substrate binding protein, partial [Streptococcus suis]